MPSERRLHPATLLFDLAGHVKRFAVPAVLVALGMSSSAGGPAGRYGRGPDGWELWLLLLFLPATLLSIARYLSFRLRYDEHELVINTGLIFRNERHIPYSRVQNVDAVQNAVHRLLNVVEVRLETGGGREEEARLSVLPLAALDELRARVVGRTAIAQPETAMAPEHPVLLHMPLKEVLLLGLLENRGMVLIGAGFGALWEMGIVDRLSGRFFGGANRGFIREQARSIFEEGSIPIERLAILLAAIAAFLIIVRIISMIWAFMRLYDFRLTRIGEDLRTEYGLFTRVTATVPLRRVQTLTIGSGPLYRLLKRTTVRVATAGGAGARDQSAVRGREWLAPLIREDALPNLLQNVIPGLDLSAVNWQLVHPRAFARAVKPALIFPAILTTITALAVGWAAAIVLAITMLPWTVIGTRQHVAHLGWAEGDEVVMMRSGWLWQQITIARVNKIQAVAMHQSPFDRRAAMARVRVDTAGAREFSHRVDVPYLDRDVARGLAQRLSAYAANTAFRW